MKIMYLGTNIRPDLLTALSGLSMHMQEPLEWHMKILDRVIGYIALTQHAGITIRPVDSMDPKIFVDAGFAQHSDMYGHTGGVVMLGDEVNSLIMAKSSKQKQVVTSSTACELVGLSTWVDIALRIGALLKFQTGTTRKIIIFQDNTSAITIAYMGRISSNCNSRFMDIRFAYIKQFLDNHIIQLRYLPREGMLADLFASPRNSG